MQGGKKQLRNRYKSIVVSGKLEGYGTAVRDNLEVERPEGAAQRDREEAMEENESVLRVIREEESKLNSEAEESEMGGSVEGMIRKGSGDREMLWRNCGSWTGECGG